MKQYDITIESGADFYLPLKLRDGAGDPIDLTGAAITAQLREYPEAQDYFQFTASHNGAGGRITLSMGHEATAQIGYTAGYYDVFVDYPDETREKVLWGEVAVQPNVTKPIAGTPMVVLSFASEDEFPLSGLTDRIYLSHASGKLYRWNGTTYVGTRAEIDWEDVKEKPEVFPPAEHTHDDRYYTISEMDTALERKADAGDSYTKEEEDDLLSGKADADHTHEWDEIQDKPETFPPETHNHDNRYFTKTETTTLLSGKANVDHNHDGVYSAIDHDHDGIYSPVGHDHDGVYSPVGHNHDAAYSAIDHTHDYTEIENTPILGSLASKDTVDWDTDIDNIPNEFPPESHTHDDRYYTKTEVDTALDSKASIIRTSSSGSLVHLTDAAAMPVDALTVGIEPVQDLHGQSAPYPAGGGKNKLAITLSGLKSINTAGTWSSNVYTMNSVTFTVTTDGDDYVTKVVANGTATGGTSTLLFIGNGTHNELLGMIVNGCPSGGATNKYSITGWNATDNQSIGVYDVGSGMTLPTALQDKSFRIYIAISNGFNVSNANFYPMIRPSSVSDGTFAPYSNVCPISGHTSAVVTRTGGNLFDKMATDTSNGFIANSYINESGYVNANQSSYNTSEYIGIKGGEQITISGTSGWNPSACFYDAEKNFISGFKYNAATSVTQTAPSNAKYIRMSLLIANLDIIQLEYGTASAYQPYQPIQTVTIDLDGTRYGGTLDVTNGTMTVTHKPWDKALLSGVYHVTGCEYRANYNVITDAEVAGQLRVRCSMFDGQTMYNSTIPGRITIGQGKNLYFTSEGKTETELLTLLQSSAFQLVYPLAEPFTVQLTPAELSLLYGTNNIWASTGDVNVGYRADTKLYIDRKIAELQALILDN